MDHAEGKRREEDMHKEGQKLGKGRGCHIISSSYTERGPATIVLGFSWIHNKAVLFPLLTI